jgi:hypothetical protein
MQPFASACQNAMLDALLTNIFEVHLFAIRVNDHCTHGSLIPIFETLVDRPDQVWHSLESSHPAVVVPYFNCHCVGGLPRYHMEAKNLSRVLLLA